MRILEIGNTVFLQVLFFVYLHLVEKSFEKSRRAVYIAFGLICCLGTVFYGHMLYGVSKNLLDYSNGMVLYQILFCIAIVDYRRKKIPDSLLLAGSITRIVVWCVGILFCKWEMKETVIGGVLGMVGMLVLLGAVYVISKKSIGLGDVKLFGMLGLYLCFDGAFVVLLAALFLSGGYAVFGILRKKKQKEDVVAFAPFVFIAFLLQQCI